MLYERHTIIFASCQTLWKCQRNVCRTRGIYDGERACIRIMRTECEKANKIGFKFINKITEQLIANKHRAKEKRITRNDEIWAKCTKIIIIIAQTYNIHSSSSIFETQNYFLSFPRPILCPALSLCAALRPFFYYKFNFSSIDGNGFYCKSCWRVHGAKWKKFLHADEKILRAFAAFGVRSKATAGKSRCEKESGRSGDRRLKKKMKLQQHQHGP